MNNQERYEDAVHRLAECGYEVFLERQGYIVRHLIDSSMGWADRQKPH